MQSDHAPGTAAILRDDRFVYLSSQHGSDWIDKDAIFVDRQGLDAPKRRSSTIFPSCRPKADRYAKRGYRSILAMRMGRISSTGGVSDGARPEQRFAIEEPASIADIDAVAAL